MNCMEMLPVKERLEISKVSEESPIIEILV